MERYRAFSDYRNKVYKKPDEGEPKGWKMSLKMVAAAKYKDLLLANEKRRTKKLTQIFTFS